MGTDRKEIQESGFTLEQENAIWQVIRTISIEIKKGSKEMWHREKVFKMIKEEID